MRPEIAPFLDELRTHVPRGIPMLDAHAHLGVDEDGRSLDPPALFRQLDRVGIERACVFAMHDPERVPAYRTPNDRVLDWAAEHDGRLIPFCRLDPSDGAIAEAERCLARGARGIKLHPRAQAFGFDGDAIDAVFRIAGDANVPVMVHAGRGLAPIASDLCDVALRHPDAPIVLAHAGVADQAVFATRLAEHPAAYFDTSVFGPIDLLELFARVPAERIVYGSDPPFGHAVLGLYVTVRCAVAAGLDDDAMHALLGGTMTTVLDGGPAVAPTPPRRSRHLVMVGALARLHAYCSSAFDVLRAGDPATARVTLDLALGVCRDPDPGPGEHALRRLEPVLRAVATAIDDGRRVPLDALYLAMVLAATEPATVT